MIKLLSLSVFLISVAAGKAAVAGESGRTILKRGTIDCDMVETTPLVFHGKLYRFEYVRTNYRPNTTGKSYFRLVDVAAEEATPAFAQGYHLGSAFVDEDTVYAYGIPTWGAPEIAVFWSTDLKTWNTQTALLQPRWEIFNTSVCRGAKGYTMAIELGGPPEEVGERFTMRFAESADLKTWTPLPAECVYAKDRYTACPALRYLDGQYYMVYLEAYPGPAYDPHIVRSRDLVAWESSPYNPILRHDADDQRIANPKLTQAQQDHIAKAVNINNSDVDFCEFEGKTVIYYSWGNQEGIEFLATAEYRGSEGAFLRGYFPDKAARPEK